MGIGSWLEKSTHNPQTGDFFLILLNLILKLPFLFVDVFPSDVTFYASTGWLLLNRVLPYSSFSRDNIIPLYQYWNSIHPNGPFNYLYYSGIVLAFGDSVPAIKFTWLIADIVIAIYLVRLGRFWMVPQKAIWLGILYTVCIPCYYPGILVGCDELITSAFVIMALYYFYAHRPVLAGFWLSLGFAYKLYPLFLFPPILLDLS